MRIQQSPAGTLFITVLVVTAGGLCACFAGILVISRRVLILILFLLFCGEQRIHLLNAHAFKSVVAVCVQRYREPFFFQHEVRDVIRRNVPALLVASAAPPEMPKGAVERLMRYI